MQKKDFVLITVALGVVAFLLQLIDVWSIIASRPTMIVVSAVLVHAGALVLLTSILVKIHQNVTVTFTEAGMLAFIILISWSSDLRLIEKFASP